VDDLEDGYSSGFGAFFEFVSLVGGEVGRDCVDCALRSVA